MAFYDPSFREFTGLTASGLKRSLQVKERADGGKEVNSSPTPSRTGVSGLRMRANYGDLRWEGDPLIRP